MTEARLVPVLEQLVAEADEGRTVTLLALALSNGEEIAHSHGVTWLEQALAELARRVAERVQRHAGRVLRTSPLGGVLVAAAFDRHRLQQEVAAAVEDLREVVAIGAHEVWPVLTAGVRTCVHGDDVSAALRQVRATLLDAAVHAPGTTRWHDPQRDGAVAAHRLALVRDLALALRSGSPELRVAYQPVVGLGTGAMLGAEALLRWDHPERGPVSPLDAVAAAERSGLVHQLGSLVLDHALAQAVQWRRVAPGFVVHVNVSPYELREATYAEEVAAALRAHGVPPDALLLELTESDLMAGDAAVLRTLGELRAHGVRLGIDDFGTGYSSIAHLHDLPVDTVKVDRSLVSGIATSAADFGLLRAVLSLLATAPVDVVAEGVEDAVQAAHLRALGCRAAQGFHLGRPVPPEQLAVTPAPAPAVPDVEADLVRRVRAG